MGAKRAVPGRSLPYDVLLQQYQKKNQAKLHKAALASGAPLPEDGLDGGGQGPVDSDEEREAVMAGVARAAPRPLAERVGVSVRQRVQAVRMREMLSQALAGNRGGNLFAVGPRKGMGAGASGGGDMPPPPPATSATLADTGSQQQLQQGGAEGWMSQQQQGLQNGGGAGVDATRTPVVAALLVGVVGVS